MTQQEKLLAGCLVGVIAVAGGYTLAKSKIYAPRVQLKKDVKNEIERRDKLEVRLAGADKIVRAWQKYTEQTLGTDPAAAHAAFREDVEGLLKRNGLAENLTINQPPERPDKKGARQGFVELPLSVTVKSKLGNLVNFLKDIYQRPYLVRVDKLHLRAELARKSKRKDKGADSEPKLSITMTLSTLVLPTLEDLDHPTIDPAALNNPEGEPPLVSAARLKEEDPVGYNEIANVNLFKPYEPPPVVQKPPERKPAEKLPETKPSPPPDPRRNAHKFVLSGVGQLAKGPVAYVINTDARTAPPTEYRLNDTADDGTVVLIVPEGMVVRVVPKSGQSHAPKNYFYRLGGNFKERKEVNPSEHPELSRLLRLVLKQ